MQGSDGEAEKVLPGYPQGQAVGRAHGHGPPTALSSGHGPAASLRLHRTVPVVEGVATTVRPGLAPRNQARRLSAHGAPGWFALRRHLNTDQRSGGSDDAPEAQELVDWGD